jgi:hypothetical protein
MDFEKMIDTTIKIIKDVPSDISDKYESHIREKAIEDVNKKIEEKGLKVEQIENDDYEAMISDLSKDIRADYAKKAAQGLLAFVGLDMIMGW